MLNLGPNQKILLAVEPVDFRKGIDGLAAVCRQRLQSEPWSGVLFVFCNRRRSTLKLLQYDGQGYWLAQKRLSKGKFKWWPAESRTAAASLAARQLAILLWNGDPRQSQLAPLWRPLEPEPKLEPRPPRGGSPGASSPPRPPASAGDSDKERD
jgi:transposase